MKTVDKYLKEWGAPSKDDLNPEMMFQTFDTSLLVGIVNGKIDAKKFAMKELKNRDLDKNGKWRGR